MTPQAPGTVCARLIPGFYNTSHSLDSMTPVTVCPGKESGEIPGVFAVSGTSKVFPFLLFVYANQTKPKR